MADGEAAALRAAALIGEAARAAVSERGTFSLALSGGKTPRVMYAQLAVEDVPWEAVELFQVDERIAPDGHDDRNLTHLQAGLPAAALERLHPMPVTAADPDAAAGEYDGVLPPAIDLVHLGIGPDGHTASLVPGDDVLKVSDRRVALTGEYQGRRRMTLTYPGLSAARRSLWLVSGEDKRDALARLLAHDPSIPAGRVEIADSLVVADRAAAGAG